MFSPNGLIVLLLIAVPAVLRLNILDWNFACIGGLSIFCGMYIRRRWLAIGIPLSAMLLSDIGLGIFHHNFQLYVLGPNRAVVYLSYVVMIALGFGVRRHWQRTDSATNGSPSSTRSPWMRYVPVAGATLAGSMFFFIATNLGVWVFDGFYPYTWDGLVKCYVEAIPFYRTTFASDLTFTLLFVSAYEAFFKSRVPVTSASRWLYAE